MSTVPGFPDATSPTPESVLLWATEGSGASRDKKVTALNLVKDMIPGAMAPAVTNLSAASTLTGTELLPVVQTTTKKVTVKDLLAEGIPTLDTQAAILSGDRLVVTPASGDAKRLPVSALAQASSWTTLGTTGLDTFELIGATGAASETNVTMAGSYLEAQAVPALGPTATKHLLVMRADVPAATVVSSARDFELYTENIAAAPLGYDYPGAGTNPVRMATAHLFDPVSVVVYIVSAQFSTVITGLLTAETTIKLFQPGETNPMTYADWVGLFSTRRVILSLEHSVVVVP